MKALQDSELILNEDGSVYHLHLRPEHISNTIITVGDPDRVARVSKYFDEIEFKTHKREFVTHTGRIGKKRLTVISTGIGTDNVDIVFNELDALVNIDLTSRVPKSTLTSLDFIRIGTSGTLRDEIAVDDILVSSFGLGMEGLLRYYAYSLSPAEQQLKDNIFNFARNHNYDFPLPPYFVEASRSLVKELKAPDWHEGITVTAAGFYAPQMRQLRASIAKGNNFFDIFTDFDHNGLKVTNLEMETAAIYGLSRILGHRAISINAILANRKQGTFSKQPAFVVDALIKSVLEKLETL